MISKKLDLIMLIVLASILGVLINITLDLKEDGARCLADPLVYGYNELDRVNKDEMICSCTLQTPGGTTMFFNGTSKHIFNIADNSPLTFGYPTLNLTLANNSFLSGS